MNLTWHEAAPKLLGLDPPADAEMCSLPGASTNCLTLQGFNCGILGLHFCGVVCHYISLMFLHFSTSWTSVSAFASHLFHILINLDSVDHGRHDVTARDKEVFMGWCILCQAMRASSSTKRRRNIRVHC